MLIVAVIVVPVLRGEDGDDPLQLAAGQAAGGFQDTVDKALPSVVQIEAGDSLGSGVVLDDEGYVVTNAHVVGGAQRFRVTAADGARYGATLRGSSRRATSPSSTSGELISSRPRSPTRPASRLASWRSRSAIRWGFARVSRRASSARRAGRWAKGTVWRCLP
jgi:hypothetical protein